MNKTRLRKWGCKIWTPAPVFGVAIVLCLCEPTWCKMLGFVLAFAAFQWRSAQYWSIEAEAQTANRVADVRESRITELTTLVEGMVTLLSDLTTNQKHLTTDLRRMSGKDDDGQSDNKGAKISE